jgi:hypothetical protein
MTRKQQKPRDVLADALNHVPICYFEEFHEHPERCLSGWDEQLVAKFLLKRLAAAGYRITGGDAR